MAGKPPTSRTTPTTEKLAGFGGLGRSPQPTRFGGRAGFDFDATTEREGLGTNPTFCLVSAGGASTRLAGFIRPLNGGRTQQRAEWLSLPLAPPSVERIRRRSGGVGLFRHITKEFSMQGIKGRIHNMVEAIAYAVLDIDAAIYKRIGGGK